MTQQGIGLTLSRERGAATFSGYPPLAGIAVLLAITIFSVTQLATDSWLPLFAILPVLCVIGGVVVAARPSDVDRDGVGYVCYR